MSMCSTLASSIIMQMNSAACGGNHYTLMQAGLRPSSSVLSSFKSLQHVMTLNSGVRCCL